MQEFELLEHVNNRFDRAGAILGISPDRLKFYRTCDRLIRFKLPLHREHDGSLELITAYRVVHKEHKMPAKGGLRINRYNTSRDMEAIAL